MASTARVVLFSEVNSKLGSPFLDMLHHHPLIDLAAVVTSPPATLCDYFIGDTQTVDLEDQAKKYGVEVLRPASVNDPEAVSAVKWLEPDYLIVANFQQVIKKGLIEVPKVTSINFHPSQLPLYAGLAPFYWMVRNGETEGAVSAIELAAGLDTGAIISQHKTPLTGRETAIELRTLQERANVLMLLDLIPNLAKRSLTRREQNLGERTYFGRPGSKEYRLDFAYPAEVVARHVRAGYRHPGAFAEALDGSRIKILSVAPSGTSSPQSELVPGLIRGTVDGVYVGCADEWLRITTIGIGEVEVPAQSARLVDGQRLVVDESVASGSKSLA
ncbi:methionyl-tRNA formyltransferase [Cryobacterium sp. N21]|uniref:methionyl-tRNA formyltransferase n=1 Tax=Cryobacterium sp. N21 TaxID=2048289 RepID=UPI000CE55488|nr:formyltransferase family protein [Cryobacterium sp. N21]